MERLINFSGPCIHGRVGGTHTQKRERDAPACNTDIPRLYLARWLCREANSFSKVPECIVSRASFLSFSSVDRTLRSVSFHFIPCIYLARCTDTGGDRERLEQEHPFIRWMGATRMGSHTNTPEAFSSSNRSSILVIK